jgi:hypothetical protein
MMKVYNFICTLKGQTFKYKVEAESELQAKIKVREHIKNTVELQLVEKEIKQDDSIIDFFKNNIFK